jgi:hypothetical protein
VSLDVQTGGLQMFFDRQKQRSNEENIGRGRVIVCFNFFEKKNSRHLLGPASYLSHF